MVYLRIVLGVCCLCSWGIVGDLVYSQQMADKSIAQLIESLSDSEVGLRRDAIYELVRRGDTSRSVIDAYLNSSNDQDVQVRIQSLTGLARAGRAAEPAVEVLIQKLDDRDNQVRLRAVDAVGKIGEVAVQPLLQKSPGGSAGFKIAACQALGKMGPAAKPAIPWLLAEVQNGTAAGGAEERTNRPRRRDREASVGGDSSIAEHAAAALLAIEGTNEELLLVIAAAPSPEARLLGISGLAGVLEPSPAVVEQLQLAVQDEDPRIREVGLIVVSKANLALETKESLLEAALLDSEASVRSAANIGMRRARLGGERFAQRLAARLVEADLATAVSVLEALSAVGPAARVGLTPIAEVVQRFGVAPPATDDPAGVEQAASDAAATPEQVETGLPHSVVVAVLAGMGPDAVHDLLNVVSARPELEAVVADALTRIGQPAIDSLMAGMQDSNPAIRMASLRAIGAIKPLSDKGLANLISASRDSNVELRTAAVAALVQASADNAAAQTAVVEALQDESDQVRAVAVSALGDTGFSREQRREGFRRGLNDASAAVRVSALQAIAKTPGQMQRHAGTIIEHAAAPEEEVRLAAVQTLAKVPKEVYDAEQFAAKDIVAAMVRRCLQDEAIPVRIAASALVVHFELYTREHAEACLENLSGSRELVVATLEVLPKFPAESTSGVGRLQPLLAHESTEVRIATVTALASMGREPVQLTEMLLPMLEDPEWVVRRIAGQSLGRQGSVAVTAVPKLFQLLGRHEDKDYAAESLRQIDTAPGEMLPTLLENIDSSDRRKAFYAVMLLGKLGSGAQVAIPKLEALLEADSQGGTPLDDFRRNTIKEAIAKIRPPVATL